MALALIAAVFVAAVAVVVGDNGRLPSAAKAASPPVAAPPGEVAKRAAARERMRSARRGDDLSWPMHGRVTSGFGEPRGGHAHAGLDIPMAAGTPIKAAAGGVVVLRESQDGYGRYTCVAHTRITTCYAHQSRFRTSLDATVRRGQTIGYVGNTGNSGVTHLHFEVRRGTRAWGKPVDPAERLPRRERDRPARR